VLKRELYDDIPNVTVWRALFETPCVSINIYQTTRDNILEDIFMLTTATES
jgi:hypothetical protein